MWKNPSKSETQVRRRAMSQLRDSEAEKESLLSLVCMPVRPSTDSTRPTHTGEHGLPYSVYQFQCRLIQDTFTDTPRMMCS